MDFSTIDLDEYFERIGYSGSKKTSEILLGDLHRSQVCRIPFENFDIAMGRNINLEPEALYRKLVCKPRGGYCFELNGLFYLVLKALGFDARRLLGRIHLTETPTGRGHQLTMVTIKGRQWIADVGFGHPGIQSPIPFEIGWETVHGDLSFRLQEAGEFGTKLQVLNDHEWRDLFSFDQEHVCDGDIEYGNYFNTTHPNSFFKTGRVAAMPTNGGVATIYEDCFTKSDNGREQTTLLTSPQAYLDCLKSEFGIEFEASDDLSIFQ